MSSTTNSTTNSTTLPLTIDIRDVTPPTPPVTIIRVIGYLDAHTASDLESTLRTVVERGSVRFVVDFSELDYISSAGLGVFMVFIEPVRQAGGDLKLAAMTDRVYSVFDLLGFPVVFNIYGSTDEAVAAFPDLGSKGDSSHE